MGLEKPALVVDKWLSHGRRQLCPARRPLAGQWDSQQPVDRSEGQSALEKHVSRQSGRPGLDGAPWVKGCLLTLGLRPACTQSPSGGF